MYETLSVNENGRSSAAEDRKTVTKRPQKVLCLFVFVTAILLTTCVLVIVTHRRPQNSSSKTVIVIGLDGFSSLLFEKVHVPNLKAIASEGVQVRRMRPVFPSITFPNFYAIATGMYPESHGIVDNFFFDPSTRKTFALFTGDSAADGSFYKGEPIWNTGEKNISRFGSDSRSQTTRKD